MKIIGITSDGYNELIPGYIQLLDKYWENHPEVIILGYGTRPDFIPDKVEWIDMAVIPGCGGYGSCIKAALENIEDELVLIGMCKHILVDYVDISLIEKSIELMEDSSLKVGKIWLNCKLDNDEYYKKEMNSIDSFWEWGKPNTTCQIPGSNQPSIWNKRFYEEVIPDNKNYLSTETTGTENFKNMQVKDTDWKVLFHKNTNILPHADATTGGQQRDKHMHLVKDEDRFLFPPKGWRSGDGFWEIPKEPPEKVMSDILAEKWEGRDKENGS